ncbi:MAG: metallophosphoesterase [Acidobacteriia bacterium]|nr:metallophosphoesterase [Terriglobia bacterium]
MKHRRMLSFLLLLVLPVLCFGADDSAKVAWTGVEKIVAIGDIHGDHDKLSQILQTTGLMDAKKRWTGGKTHLVQTGDVVDRGPESRKAMDLLIKLEKEAKKAGGIVHSLMGNHEAMNVYGDLRYVSPQEYAEFKNSESEKLRTAFFEQAVEESKAASKASGGAVAPDRVKWDQEHPLGFFEHRLAYGPKGTYGKWIRDKNAIVQINGLLFLHGGLSLKYAVDPLPAINDRIRAELKDFALLQNGAAMAEDGPLWHRGWAEGDEATLDAELTQVLAKYGATRMVVGHTITPSKQVSARFQGKLLMIDVGMSSAYGGKSIGYLVCEKGACYGMDGVRRIALPALP